MSKENLYTETEVLAAIAGYRSLEQTASQLFVEDKTRRESAAKSILEAIIPNTLGHFVPEEIRKKVSVTRIIYDAKTVLGMDRTVEEEILKRGG